MLARNTVTLQFLHDIDFFTDCVEEQINFVHGSRKQKCFPSFRKPYF